MIGTYKMILMLRSPPPALSVSQRHSLNQTPKVLSLEHSGGGVVSQGRGGTRTRQDKILLLAKLGGILRVINTILGQNSESCFPHKISRNV